MKVARKWFYEENIYKLINDLDSIGDLAPQTMILNGMCNITQNTTKILFIGMF